MADNMEWIPLGGLGEVGMNNMLVRSGTHSMLLDCGTASSHSPWLGYDSVAPDFRYLFGEGKSFAWPTDLLITHGHEDHIGAIPLFLKHCPEKVVIHASPFTMDLIRKKLAEYPSLKNSYDLEAHPQNQAFSVGPWEVTYFFNNHSIVDSNCLFLKNGDFKVFHTGDFRLDRKEFKDPVFQAQKLKDTIGEVDLLLSDSTNSERPGWSLGEADIGDNFEKIISRTEGAVVVSLFASNVRRLQHIIEAAKACGRKLCFMGRSMDKFVDLAQVNDIFQIKEDERILVDDLKQHYKSDYVLFVTGSQGEYQAALSRIVHDQFKNFYFEEGDCFIHSALKIPGNETRIRNIFNRMVERGVEVVQNRPEELVHTTGHAYEDELKEVLSCFKPKNFLPVHGDGSMLKKHGQIAKEVSPSTNVFRILNGSGLFWDGKEFEKNVLLEDMPKAWIKFKFSGSVNSKEIREKKKVAREGLIQFTYDPESLFTDSMRASLSFTGCHFMEDDEVDEDYILDRIRSDFYHGYDSRLEVNDWIRNWLRGFIKRRFGQRPVIKIQTIK